MQIATCKLCLRNRPLCKSHLIPRAVYALCRAQKARNPNPYLVTHKFAMQSSRHMQVPLLCNDCEQLLRASGEDWLIPELARLGQAFPLFEKLRTAIPLYNEPDFVAYLLANVPTIRVPHLIHCITGIFWKASVHAWRKGPAKPWISLGAHSDLLRQFLLGEAGFPQDMSLSIIVVPPPSTLIGFHPPYQTKGPDPIFHLYLCGINCTLWKGQNIPPEIAAGSIHRPPYYLLVADVTDMIKRKYRAAFESATRLNRAQAPRL